MKGLVTNGQFSQQPLSTEAGASVYSPAVLKLYDWWVLGLSNRFAWECPTKTVLLPFFKEHIGQRHLDVGVGTGFYLAHAGLGVQHETLSATVLRRDPHWYKA